MKISNENKSFFIGNSLLGKNEMDVKERVAAKKQFYQKKAMRVVTSAREGEQRIDDSIETVRERIRVLKGEYEEATRYIEDFHSKMAQAKEDYNIKDDSQEQQDLELMQKVYDAKKDGSIELTKEELQRFAQMEEPTEYQKLSMELYKQADYWQEKVKDIKTEMAGDTSAIREVKIERLKSQAMLKAQKAKDELLEAASKEAISMLVEDVKENIDEKAEEVQEAVEEKKEEKAEQEEQIKAAKENKTEAAEKGRENVQNLTEQAVKSEKITKDMDEEIQKFLEEEKLLEEDLKGLMVDTEI